MHQWRHQVVFPFVVICPSLLVVDLLVFHPISFFNKKSVRSVVSQKKILLNISFLYLNKSLAISEFFVAVYFSPHVTNYFISNAIGILSYLFEKKT
jgi:hypothetical protein